MHTFTGQTLFDREGEEVGEIVDVIGVATDEPSWLAVKTGWFSVRLLPTMLVDDRVGQHTARVTRDVIKSAPKVPAHIEPVSSEEAALYSHYGIAPALS